MQSLCSILHKKSLTATEPDAEEQEKSPTIFMSIEEAQGNSKCVQCLSFIAVTFPIIGRRLYIKRA